MQFVSDVEKTGDGFSSELNYYNLLPLIFETF